MTPTTPTDPPPRAGNRGGPRPGAGAPKGNLNALRSGRYVLDLDAFYYALPAAVRSVAVLVAVFAALNERLDTSTPLTSIECAQLGLLRVRSHLRTVDWSLPRISAAAQQAAFDALQPVLASEPERLKRFARALRERAQQQSDNQNPFPQAIPGLPSLEQSNAFEALTRLAAHHANSPEAQQ